MYIIISFYTETKSCCPTKSQNNTLLEMGLLSLLKSLRAKEPKDCRILLLGSEPSFVPKSKINLRFGQCRKNDDIKAVIFRRHNTSHANARIQYQVGQHFRFQIECMGYRRSAKTSTILGKLF